MARCRTKGSVRAVYVMRLLAMPQNFIAVDREQSFLLAPWLRDWLPADHLAVVCHRRGREDGRDPFYADYCQDGDGRAACEPSMMVALVLYAFATRQRSSPAIKRRCRQNIAFRVICGNLIPDHATIARFIDRHEEALAGLFGEVLALCAKARAGEGRCDRGRWHQGAGQRQP
jgi:transposase